MSSKPAPLVPAPALTVGSSVAEVFDRYLDWCQKRRSARTYEWYKDHIQRFLDSLPDPAAKPVADLKRPPGERAHRGLHPH